MEQSNALLQNLLGNTMGTADKPASFLDQLIGGLFSGSGNSISTDDFVRNMLASGGGTGSTTPFTTESFVGNLGAYDPDAYVDYLGGGSGVNLPPTGP